MAQVRSALVIVNGHYPDSDLPDLPGALGDAEALARALGDPMIGGFDVAVMAERTREELHRQIERFFADRGRDDLLLLYVICHGLADAFGRDYLAARNTELRDLPGTAISVEYINEQVMRSRSRATVLIVDCLFRAASPDAVAVRTAAPGDRFEGLDRVVIAAGNGAESFLTQTLVRGLDSGAADLDGDGEVTDRELYEYLRDQLRANPGTSRPSQDPTYRSTLGGSVVIARNPVMTPGAGAEDGASFLPLALLEAMRSPVVEERMGVVSQLEDVLRSTGPRRGAVSVPAARHALATLAADGSQAVSSAAAGVLARNPAPEPTRTEPAPEAEAGYPAEPIVSSDYWTTEDELDYAPYATAIAEFIQHEDTRPPLTIGVKAPWGAGKTSLMRMIQDRLDPPKAGTASAPGAHRQRVRLTAAARRVLAGRSRRSSAAGGEQPPVVTNRALLRKLNDRARRAQAPDPSSPGAEADLDALRIDASGLADWRPTVWFNPWMYQSGEQIWAGLAHEIIAQVTQRMGPADREAFWLELNVRRLDGDALRRRVHRALFERLLPLVAGFCVAAVVAVVALLCRSLLPEVAGALNAAGRGLLAAGTVGTVLAGVWRTVGFWREHVAGTLSTLVRPPDYLRDWQRLAGQQGAGAAFTRLVGDPGYEGRLGFLYLVQTDMRRVLDLVATEDRPLVVFVDDLDRCSPGTVAQVIEAINLFLAGQFPNCVFIVAMEPEMVAAHIEVAYQPLVDTLTGDDYWGEAHTLGWRFLDKIVQLPISLPALRSDQAGRFLGTSLVGGPVPAAAGRDGDADPDEDRVRRIEAAIREQRPSIENLSEAAASAQQRVGGASVPATGFDAETRVALRRELRRRLRPDNPEVQAVVAAVAGRLARNPREIKRFVNVFRFYAVIRQEREAAGLPVPDTLAEVAKLAVLAVRWPHLRSALGRQVGATERDTVLSLLEAPIAELPEDAAWADRRKALETVLTDAQLPERLRTNLLASEDLCHLLTCAPSIGNVAAGYL
ncbi:hypothetical protein GCM10023322_49070 [Rugosimonospora acidiphila]|uniref:Caspase family p20 domain-containing protein n=1 Tax=Rugosimonospora acidiphila TaxID=556531 RepID=A0ABP9S6N2_9ACTN